ncbi:MAG: four helix bundle protein [Phycisphaerales bacterium]|nr:MAG: four helix bundle protein [Phycisphaerales bacterium]
MSIVDCGVSILEGVTVGTAKKCTSADELKERTKRFALRVVKLCAALPRNATTDVLGRQLLRAATSVGANYRAACRARSRSEFVSRMAIVEEEADESAYWIEMLTESGQIAPRRVSDLREEADELTAIASASRKTARTRANRQSTTRNRQSQ